MLRIAICDDERYIQGQLETLLEDLGKRQNLKLELEIFEDGAEIVRNIAKGQRFDIIFMDIEMINVDGIEAALQIRELDKGVQIIYVTSHDEYMRDVFEVAPIGFVSKPITQEEVEPRFLNALNYVKNQDAYYRFQFYKSQYQVPIKKIMYFHSHLRNLDIVCEKEKFQQYAKMSDAEKQLAASECEFLRIHRSYLFNRRYLKKYAYDHIILQNGKELPIGNSYIEKMQKILGKA